MRFFMTMEEKRKRLLLWLERESREVIHQGNSSKGNHQPLYIKAIPSTEHE